MATNIKFEYGTYVDHVNACYKKFGGILDAPIIKSAYDEVARNYTTGNVLDLGSGEKKPLLKVLKNKFSNGKYFSLDTDPKGTFDFNDIKEIPSDLKFDLIVANQVFEHLTIDESLELLSQANEHLTENGKIIATVPNISHPTRQLSNITHKTPWGHNSFYALFQMTGLETKKIARYSKKLPRGIMERILGYYMNRLYRIDYCDSILLIATRK